MNKGSQDTHGSKGLTENEHDPDPDPDTKNCQGTTFFWSNESLVKKSMLKRAYIEEGVTLNIPTRGLT